ncbi:energy transducer TonB [Jejuia pallidilutea]|uniref:Regulatory sensor-transducer n=1 Tax=Jejuia pallidilutea TaxID=504487 RepID=A0A090VMM2_9FLAO|nr:energy transducer TonB [Jejuia pallidilutea]GAL65961.1 regulatory sensor-transducer [Jejuia pallidilutea]GAL88025.1 TonB-dependent receptor [Jejuia pallidilutea]
MKNSKTPHELIRQNEQIVKQSQKHDTNLQKNSILYFQVGLIVCLLAALGLLEMQFENRIPNYGQDFSDTVETFEIEVPNFRVYEAPKPEVKPKVLKKKVSLIKTPKIIENNDTTHKILEIETPDEMTSDVPFDPNSLNIEKPIETTIVDFVFIEEAPIYPGCEDEKGNKARKKCMSDKITRLVQSKFNGGDIASKYGLSGRQKIYVQFQIDKTGKVVDVKTQAAHPKLKDEAERVVNKIPKMKPGIQFDKPVGVRYNLPITFIAQ